MSRFSKVQYSCQKRLPIYDQAFPTNLRPSPSTNQMTRPNSWNFDLRNVEWNSLCPGSPGGRFKEAREQGNQNQGGQRSKIACAHLKGTFARKNEKGLESAYKKVQSTKGAQAVAFSSKNACGFS